MQLLSYPNNKNTKIDSVSMLATFALMPCYPEGTRIGILNHHKVVIQESYKLVESSVLTIDYQSLTRMYHGDGRDEAAIFYKTITEGIRENENRQGFHRLCQMAQEGLIQYIKQYKDDEDNAWFVFDQCRKDLVQYGNKQIIKPETFNEKSKQKWDDEQLNNLIKYIEMAKSGTNKLDLSALEAATHYLDSRQKTIEPRLREELEALSKKG